MADDYRAVLLKQAPGKVVQNALAKLLQVDAHLLEVDANERAISHRLAMYLQEQLPRLSVDCEYNRDGVDPKRLNYLDIHPDEEDTEAKTVFPDIIAHRRKTDENYLVIEMKKSTSTVDRKVDYAKLQGYKRQLRYRHALFIELGCLDRAGQIYVEWL